MEWDKSGGRASRLAPAGLAVSLAVALSVPETVASGAPFPSRDVIVFVTSGVILVNLLVHGIALPFVIRWAHVPEDTAVAEERRLAETLAAEEAFAALPAIADRLGTDDAVVTRTRQEYERHFAVLRLDGAAADDDPVLRMEAEYTALRLELIAHKRATVVRLRDERRIDDVVLRQLQAKLDVEELRLSRRETAE